MELFWRAESTVKGDDGSRVVTYVEDAFPGITIESRKRPIPHANGVGSWMYTDYAVFLNGQEMTVKHTLREAKEAAWQVIRKNQPEAEASGGLPPYFLPEEERRLESAEPAIDFVRAEDRPSLSAFDALDATRLDVLTTFFAMCSPPLKGKIRRQGGKGEGVRSRGKRLPLPSIPE